MTCKHDWALSSHNSFKDGEYWICEKCNKVTFKEPGRKRKTKKKR